MTSAAELIERERDRTCKSVISRIRAIALHSQAAIEHSILAKAAVDPVDVPLSGVPGYFELLSDIERAAVLPQVGGVIIPFATRAAVTVTPPQAYWVAAAGGKPVVVGSFANLELAATKVATIIVLTGEQLRFQGRGADAALRRLLVDAAVRAVNSTLLSSASAVPDASPAGLADSTPVVPASGTGEADVLADVLSLIGGMDAPTLVASLPNALRIRAALRGGDALPITIAPEAGSLVYAVDRGAIAYNLDAFDVQTSENASLSMLASPTMPANMVSMFQSDSVAMRLSMLANWEIVRADGITILDMAGSDES